MSRRHLAAIVTIGGGLIAASSIVWEYVRMAPDYRLLVTPWSLRGFELTQGWVVFFLGLGVAAVGLLASLERSSNLFTLSVAAAIWLVAVLMAQAPDPPPVELRIAALFGLVVAAFIAVILTRILFMVLGERLAKARRWTGLGVWLVLTLVVYFVAVAPFAVNERRTVDLSVLIAILFAIGLGGALTARPRELAVNRMAIFTVLIAWITVAAIGASTRSRLIQEQLEELGVSAQYQDTQITSGVMIAFVGMLLAFFGAVGLWARRRDHITALARAKRQLDAAEESAAEIEAAI